MALQGGFSQVSFLPCRATLHPYFYLYPYGSTIAWAYALEHAPIRHQNRNFIVGRDILVPHHLSFT